jgi:hypothetical protein
MQNGAKGVPDGKRNCHHPPSALKGKGEKRRTFIAQPVAFHPPCSSFFASRGCDFRYGIGRDMIDLNKEKLSMTKAAKSSKARRVGAFVKHRGSPGLGLDVASWL